MFTEVDHSRALNRAAFPLLVRKIVPLFALSFAVFAYARHCDLHKKARSTMFYNKSKMFGGAISPQY
jgi:hypothetical protein